MPDAVKYYNVNANDPTVENRYGSTNEFLWADFGALKVENRRKVAGEVKDISCVGTDGIRPWGSDTPTNDPSIIQVIQYYKPVNGCPLSQNGLSLALCAVWEARSGRWLDERLQNELLHPAPWHVKGVADIDGRRCVELERLADVEKESIWLDPQTHYLPRRMTKWMVPWEHRQLPQLPDPPTWNHAFTWDATEIGDVNGVLFFKRGTFLSAASGDIDRDRWAIDSVIVNERLSRSDFAAPAGTPGVTNITDYANMKGWRAGSPEPSNDEPLSDAVPPSRAGSAIKALPETGSLSWVILAGIALVLIGLLIALQRRRVAQNKSQS